MEGQRGAQAQRVAAVRIPALSFGFLEELLLADRRLMTMAACALRLRRVVSGYRKEGQEQRDTDKERHSMKHSDGHLEMQSDMVKQTGRIKGGLDCV